MHNVLVLNLSQLQVPSKRERGIRDTQIHLSTFFEADAGQDVNKNEPAAFTSDTYNDSNKDNGGLHVKTNLAYETEQF